MPLDVRETLSGGFGALCCAYSGNPFDVVKIRLQTQQTGGKQVYSGVIDCVSKICKQEGILALWKGVTPALSSALLENSVLFSVNGIFKRLYLSSMGREEAKSTSEVNKRSFSTIESAMLGGAGGFCSATCITPLEVIKCRTQVAVGKTTSPFEKFIAAFRETGLRGLFRGWSATVCRDVPFTFFFFGGYEACTFLLLKTQSKVFCAANPETRSLDDVELCKLNPFGIYMAGGSAGAFAWGVAFPVDCVKSYMQTYQYPTCRLKSVSFWKAISYIYHERGGMLGFYRGWSAAVIRAFPANAGLFLGYEFALELLSPQV